MPKFQQAVTKRNILSYMASIYNRLGIISPCHVLGGKGELLNLLRNYLHERNQRVFLMVRSLLGS